MSPHKNYIEFFVDGEADQFRLCYSSAPGNIALFTDSYRGAKKSNTINFFEDIYGIKIEDISIPPTDRWFYIHFENGFRLSFRLFSNRANVFLSKDNIIKEVYKEYDEVGDEAPAPQKLDLFHIDGDVSKKSTKNKLVALNPMLPRQNLKELISEYDLDSADLPELESFVRKMTEEMEQCPSFRLLENGETTLLSEEMLPVKTEMVFDDVNHLILDRYKNYSRNQRLKQRKSSLVKGLKTKIKRSTSGLKNLYQADKGLERSEKYEQWGHILMANAHLGSVNNKELEVEDLYNEGERVKIPLKRDLDIAENAQRYYKKSASAERSYKEAVERIPKMEKEKEKAERLLEQAQSINNFWEFQDWEKEHEDELQEYRTTDGNNSNTEQLPFHTLEIKGYPIWIGKNAKSNDKLMQMAHKEDVWMHARKVAGSHLIIRMGNDKGMPPKDVQLEAASYAAYNSKAKGTKLAPVIITKKKYVRKIKGSPPGVVLVDKEDVEMVEPRKPEVT
ncbi:MAG: NFACT RNA binding domain-containing protein [Gracilimonas sp.]|nr:NFACT RNA binding domain-containing protein [Gracilimonas sp.]